MRHAAKKGKKLDLEKVIGSGGGALMAGMRDRRTFKAWAKKLGIKPFVESDDGREQFLRTDAERVAKAYKAAMADKKAKKTP